jgi:SSS family solute:Na+ symporter
MANEGAGPESGVSLGTISLAALGMYLAALLAIAVYGYLKRKQSEEDYYLAGRRQGFIVSALTIMATFFSSSAILGVPGAVYKDGVPFLLFALNLPVAGAAVYLLGSRVGRIGRVKGYVTQADMLADYYGGSSGVRILVAVLGCLYALPYVIIQIRAGGNMAEQMFPGIGAVSLAGTTFDAFDLGAGALTLVMMVYILVGGMRSVALADVVQGLMLLTGMLVAGISVVAAFGGVRPYFQALQQLPPEAMSFPGASNRYTPWALMTLCAFASLASMIQPAQWMRYYAAKSAQALKRTALVFALVLPPCYLLGVMLVGLGARALYPPAMVNGVLTAHPAVGSFDQALIAALKNFGPALFGPAGNFVVAAIMMAVIAAAMSTADANLHSMGAVLTRDLYGRYLRPRAPEGERAWVNRVVIIAAALFSFVLVHVGQRNQGFAPLRMIIEMQYVAMAFSCQVLPVAMDVLFFRRGTRAGAVCGMLTGLAAVLLFTPLPTLLLGGGGLPVADGAAYLKRLFDIGFCGFVPNLAVFMLVSRFTRKPDPATVAEYARIVRGHAEQS